MEALGRQVLQDVPGLAAVLVPVDLRVGAQPRRQLGDAVPGRAEQRLGHAAQGSHCHSISRSESIAERVQIQM